MSIREDVSDFDKDGAESNADGRPTRATDDEDGVTRCLTVDADRQRADDEERERVCDDQRGRRADARINRTTARVIEDRARDHEGYRQNVHTALPSSSI